MTRITWGSPGARLFETGVDRGVFYPIDGAGVPWNGLTAINEAPSGGDTVDNHIDGQKFKSQRRVESFAFTLEAYSYPPEFELYDGVIDFRVSQRRRPFNFSYRTLLGNDTDGTSFGYKIHLVYNAMASPSPMDYKTISDTADVTPFSWAVSTAPVKMGDTSSAHMIIDTRVAYPWVIEELENLLYGTSDTEALFPSPSDILSMFENASILKIIDNGDGTWTATGPDSAIQMLDSHTFQISWPSAVYIDEHTYKISSL